MRVRARDQVKAPETTRERAVPKHDVEPLRLDFVADETRSGFRLHRLEVFNWGTFNGRVWTLALDGRNHLLTGDIGSGEVHPRGRGHHTARAGAPRGLQPGGRGRHPRADASFLRPRPLQVRTQRPQRLRPPRRAARPTTPTPSSLGVFRNEGYDQTVTLAQVFWIADAQGQPVRFFAAAEGDLSITGDFARFGTDINSCESACAAPGWRSGEPSRPMAPGSGAASESTTSRPSICSTRPSP